MARLASSSEQLELWPGLFPPKRSGRRARYVRGVVVQRIGNRSKQTQSPFAFLEENSESLDEFLFREIFQSYSPIGNSPDRAMWAAVLVRGVHDIARRLHGAEQWLAAKSEQTGGILWLCDLFDLDYGCLLRAMQDKAILNKIRSCYMRKVSE